MKALTNGGDAAPRLGDKIGRDAAIVSNELDLIAAGTREWGTEVVEVGRSDRDFSEKREQNALFAKMFGSILGSMGRDLVCPCIFWVCSALTRGQILGADCVQERFDQNPLQV